MTEQVSSRISPKDFPPGARVIGRDRKVLEVFCTDRGQHGPTTLGQISWTDGGRIRANSGTTYLSHTAERRKHECIRVEQPDPSVAEYRVAMWCPRCKRSVPWSAPNSRRNLDALHYGGVASIDISHLT